MAHRAWNVYDALVPTPTVMRIAGLDDPMAPFQKPQFVVQYAKDQPPLVLDSSRFGRRYVPFAWMLKARRAVLGVSAEQLSLAVGKERALVSKLETTESKKRHASNETVIRLARAIGLDPYESFTAYNAHLDQDLRVVAYPDDPGPAGRNVKLPLPGFGARIDERERIAGPPVGAPPRRRVE